MLLFTLNFYWIKTPKIIKKIFSNYIWDIQSKDKKVYLTFDDGPTPEITEWILAQLKIYNAKATFFCIGKNVEKHPEIFNKILSENHALGNHTFNHLNGWKTSKNEYIKNSKECNAILEKNNYANGTLFRPPYGKIKNQQAKALIKLGYKIIMWDVLSADFDQKISPQNCLKNVISNIESGSIIVFHDSEKCFKNLEYVLPKTLTFLKNNGYECDLIR